MLISCKVSNAFIKFLEQRGGDLEGLFESFDLPAELLRDPSGWVDAKAMEGFLHALDVQFGDISEGSLTTEAGHLSQELSAWGVLDSVLRMVQSPKDIFTQPDRFLAYFISPPLPLEGLRHLDEGVEFEVPLSRDEFPYFTEYLSAAMESLPTYVQQPLFKVTWTGHTLSVQWTISQTTLLGGGDAEGRQLEPEMVRRVLLDLEDQQRKLEEVQKKLYEKEAEVERLRLSSAPRLNGAGPTLSSALQDLYTLRDYWLRATQLITLLVNQGRLDRQVREAMHRVDWESVVLEAPHLLQKASGALQSLHLQSLDTVPAPASQPNSEKPSTNLTLPLGT